ncbi:zinc ribbon domain-containing protein [Paenibacillus tengchongensis]|uniref:zinc ribbon domain-containing protein n=1 Tax=Paenibacillus tengchongensis TaxID=2608684 RepID=UPI001FEA5FBE|nr:zinc ribbon domain-containing protein [Paenibacillus tengchongensis]
METAGMHTGKAVFCQSCGMPMSGEELLGSERDGGKSGDYCLYCYENGEFKQPDITLEAMTDDCTRYMVKDGMEEAAARRILEASLPHLKRWSSLKHAE